jgi:uncharacterized protein YutE (UPF0331/DUF86 family)
MGAGGRPVTASDISAKAAFVREALDGISAIPQRTPDEFLADPRNLASALHWMQTAIQALIDIGLILVSTRGLPAPHSSSEVLERLEASGGLPSGSAARFRPVIELARDLLLLDHVEEVLPDLLLAHLGGRSHVVLGEEPRVSEVDFPGRRAIACQSQVCFHSVS